MKEANLSAHVRGACLNEGCSETMGFPTRCPKSDPVEAVEVDEEAEKERAAVLRFLRSSWRWIPTPGSRLGQQSEVTREVRDFLAEAIERGEHLK